MRHPGLEAAVRMMREAGVSEQAVAVFATYHAQLQSGAGQYPGAEPCMAAVRTGIAPGAW